VAYNKKKQLEVEKDTSRRRRTQPGAKGMDVSKTDLIQILGEDESGLGERPNLPSGKGHELNAKFWDRNRERPM